MLDQWDYDLGGSIDTAEEGVWLLHSSQDDLKAWLAGMGQRHGSVHVFHNFRRRSQKAIERSGMLDVHPNVMPLTSFSLTSNTGGEER